MPQRLIDELIRRDVIRQEQVDLLERHHSRLGGDLDTAILELNLATETELSEAIAAAYGLDVADPSKAITAQDNQAMRAFPEQWARKHLLAPLSLDLGKVLRVLCRPPPNLELLTKLGQMLEIQIKPVLAPSIRVYQRLALLYDLSPPARVSTLLERGGGLGRDSLRPPAPDRESEHPSILTADPMTFAEAVTRLRSARDRDEIVRLTLGHARREFEFAALFAVHDDHLTGWEAEGLGADYIREILIPTGVRSAFWMALNTQAHFLGPLTDSDKELLSPLGRAKPRAALMVPLRVRGRSVAVLYVENGPRAIAPRVAASLMVLSTHVQQALENVLLRQKSGMSGRDLASDLETPLPVPEPVEEMELDEDEGPSWGDAIDEVSAEREVAPLGLEAIEEQPSLATDDELEASPAVVPDEAPLEAEPAAPSSGSSRIEATLASDVEEESTPTAPESVPPEPELELDVEIDVEPEAAEHEHAPIQAELVDPESMDQTLADVLHMPERIEAPAPSPAGPPHLEIVRSAEDESEAAPREPDDELLRAAAELEAQVEKALEGSELPVEETPSEPPRKGPQSSPVPAAITDNVEFGSLHPVGPEPGLEDSERKTWQPEAVAKLEVAEEIARRRSESEVAQSPLGPSPEDEAEGIDAPIDEEDSAEEDEPISLSLAEASRLAMNLDSAPADPSRLTPFSDPPELNVESEVPLTPAPLPSGRPAHLIDDLRQRPVISTEAPALEDKTIPDLAAVTDAALADLMRSETMDDRRGITGFDAEASTDPAIQLGDLRSVVREPPVKAKPRAPSRVPSSTDAALSPEAWVRASSEITRPRKIRGSISPDDTHPDVPARPPGDSSQVRAAPLPREGSQAPAARDPREVVQKNTETSTAEGQRVRSIPPAPNKSAAAEAKNYSLLDIETLLDQLEGPNPDARRGARDQLGKLGPSILPQVGERFPGRVYVDPFAPAGRLPAFSECGELLALLTTFGPEAHPFVSIHLDAGLPALRFFALYFYQAVHVPECIPRLLRRIHDEEPRIAMQAVQTLFAYQDDPEFDRVLQHLHDRFRTASQTGKEHAVRLLTLFRDASSVPALLDVFDKRERKLYDLAEAALAEITKQRLGHNFRRWKAWWDAHRNQPRVVWLLEGLDSTDVEMRESSIAELKLLAGTDFGFDCRAPRRKREPARMRAEQWVRAEGLPRSAARS